MFVVLNHNQDLRSKAISYMHKNLEPGLMKLRYVRPGVLKMEKEKPDLGVWSHPHNPIPALPLLHFVVLSSIY